MNPLQSFSFETARKIIQEVGLTSRLGTLVQDLGVRRALIVTDAGLLGTGIPQRAEVDLRAQGLDVLYYTDVLPDPPEEQVLAAARYAREQGVDGVIGLGGGSALDTAKLVALLVRTPQDVPYGIGNAVGPRLPLVLVPTTAGTGSEVTAISILTTPTREKKGVVSSLLYPDVAVLDAQNTLSVPPAVTAATGVDSMVHAIEAFTSRHRKNPISDVLALQALRLLHTNLPRVLEDGQDLEGRSAMLLGACLAGMAFANAPVAAVHALAYPIGGRFKVPHGLSNALVLVPVLKYNLPEAGAHYAQLARHLWPDRAYATDAQAAQAFVDGMEEFVARMPFARTLTEVGIREEHLDAMADDVIQGQQRLLVNNPREVTREATLSMYRSVLS